MSPDEAARAAPFVLKAMSPTAAPPPEATTAPAKPRGRLAQRTADIEQAKLDVQTGKPGSTVGDVAAARTGGENLDTETRQQLGALQKAQRLLRDIQAVPKARQEEYVGILRRPQAQLENLLQDMSKSGTGDRTLYRLLADVADLNYTLTRPDVGATFSPSEQARTGDIYPSATETTATAYFAKLERLTPLLESKIAEVTRNATITRKELKEQQGSPAKPAAPGQPSQPSVQERVQQMTPAQRLQRLNELEQKKNQGRP